MGSQVRCIARVFMLLLKAADGKSRKMRTMAGATYLIRKTSESLWGHLPGAWLRRCTGWPVPAASTLWTPRTLAHPTLWLNDVRLRPGSGPWDVLRWIDMILVGIPGANYKWGGEVMQPNASSNWFLMLGSVNMLLAVALGAFGAHALKATLPPDLMAVFQTGSQYHVYHALGLFAVASACGLFQASRLIRWSGGFILAGIILFSGSLYLLSLTGQRWIGMIAPFGGTAFMVGWLLLAAGVWKGRKA